MTAAAMRKTGHEASGTPDRVFARDVEVTER
jgi:hypothetical protein